MFDPMRDEDWPADVEHLRKDFAGQLNVYRVMARNPALLRAWENFRNHVVLGSSLTREQSEIVILRTGWQVQANYEISHHIVRGRMAGLTDKRIAALCTPNGPESGDDALLAHAVDELVAHHRLGAGMVQALAARLGEAGTLDVIATVGHYTTLAFIVKSFGTPIEDEIVAALAAQPL